MPRTLWYGIAAMLVAGAAWAHGGLTLQCIEEHAGAKKD